MSIENVRGERVFSLSLFLRRTIRRLARKGAEFAEGASDLAAARRSGAWTPRTHGLWLLGEELPQELEALETLQARFNQRAADVDDAIATIGAAEERTAEPVVERRTTRKAPRAARAAAGATDSIGELTGHAAVFYDPSDDEGTSFKLWDDPELVERIMPTAFDEALRRGDDARFLQDHDPSLLLGRVASGTLRLSKDRRGLAFSVALPDTTVARDVLVLARRLDLSGCSFGFSIEKEVLRKETAAGKERWIREIQSVRLFDASVCAYPAYSGTDASPSRSDLEDEDPDLAAWRDLMELELDALEGGA